MEGNKLIRFSNPASGVRGLFTEEELKDELFNKRAEVLSVNDFAALTFRMKQFN